MKKLTAILLGVMLFAPAVSFAAVDCDATPDLCGGNGSPEMVVNAYGVRNVDVPHVKSGAKVVDAAGLASFCPEWFGSMECLDVSHTAVYVAAQRAYAQLSGGAVAWVYWLTH